MALWDVAKKVSLTDDEKKMFDSWRNNAIEEMNRIFREKYWFSFSKWNALSVDQKKRVNDSLNKQGKNIVDINTAWWYMSWDADEDKILSDINDDNQLIARVKSDSQKSQQNKGNIMQWPNWSTIETFPDWSKVKTYKDSAGNAVWEHTDAQGNTKIWIQWQDKWYTKQEWADIISAQRKKKESQATDVKRMAEAVKQWINTTWQKASTTTTTQPTTAKTTATSSTQTANEPKQTTTPASSSATTASTPAKQQAYEKFDVSDFNSYLRKKYWTDILAWSRIEQAIRNYSDVKWTNPKEAFTQYSAYRMPKLRSIYSESSKWSTEIIDDMVNKGIITEDDARRWDVFWLATKSWVTGTDKEKMPVEQEYKETMVTAPVEHTVRKEWDKVIIDEKWAQDTWTYLGVKSDMPSSVGIRKTVTQKK